jgi:GMP synthase (glutamine-hydrolysing)
VVVTLMRRALAIRHVHFEDCGTLEDVLTERGYVIKYVDVGRHSLSDVELDDVDLFIGLGGPVAVYDAPRYPWIRDELSLFERCVALNKPMLAICLGAQMLAHVLGARVYPAPVKELGWKPLALTPAGRHSVVAPLGGESTSMLHWHGDTFDLPSGAELLASTPEVTNQIFSWRRALALQCHPELKAGDFERWLIGHVCEIDSVPGVRVEQLRQDTAEHAAALAQAARQMFGSWLSEQGL